MFRSDFQTSRNLIPRAKPICTSPVTVRRSQLRTSLPYNELANNAVNLSGYLIQVMGYANSNGNADVNQRLSMDRAQELVAPLDPKLQRPGEAHGGARGQTTRFHRDAHRIDASISRFW